MNRVASESKLTFGGCPEQILYMLPCFQYNITLKLNTNVSSRPKLGEMTEKKLVDGE